MFGAFAGEVLRGAFQSLTRGQIEAGQAIGMRPLQVFYPIELPQVWRFALPGLGNLWVNLLKDTALVSVISLRRPDANDQGRRRRHQAALPFYLVACCLYWACACCPEIGAGPAWKRANRGVRRA